MKVSELWLRTLINPPLSVAELSDQLSYAGIEVDAIETVGDTTKQGVWTFKIPPNRGDCLSMEGIARELSLLNDMPYEAVQVSTVHSTHSDTFPIRVEAPELCPRYYACIVRGLSRQETPAWIKERLAMAGFKCISLVVDILNYVMLELGQPMHAFDYAKLKGALVVRKATFNERLVILGGESITLKQETLVIADEIAAQAMAGVIGGLHSSVTDTTDTVLLESAYFDPIVVRLAGQQYGIKTDGAYRFERGTDPYLPKRALERALQLILENSTAKAGSILSFEAPKAILKNPTVLLRKKRITQLLGITLTDPEILAILHRAHQAVQTTEAGFLVTAPSYRHDLHIEEDFIEEIGRMIGLHELPIAMLSGSIEYPAMPVAISKSRLKQVLVDRGYTEAITYSFIDPKMLKRLNLNTPSLALQNPMTVEMAVMRQSLWPGLLQAVHYNQSRQEPRVRLFELGTCFIVNSETTIEKNYLSGVITGSLYPEQWGTSAKPHDFYDIKADLEALFALSNSGEFTFEKAEHSALHPLQTARIVRNGQPIGIMGNLHPALLKEFDLEGPFSLFELDCTGLTQLEVPICRALSKYPSVRRDIAIILDQAIEVSTLTLAISSIAGELLEQLTIFDIYQGKGITPGKKSVALGLILRHPTRTLVETEVNDIIKSVVSMLVDRFQAILRD